MIRLPNKVDGTASGKLKMAQALLASATARVTALEAERTRQLGDNDDIAAARGIDRELVEQRGLVVTYGDRIAVLHQRARDEAKAAAVAARDAAIAQILMPRIDKVVKLAADTQAAFLHFLDLYDKTFAANANLRMDLPAAVPDSGNVSLQSLEYLFALPYRMRDSVVSNLGYSGKQIAKSVADSAALYLERVRAAKINLATADDDSDEERAA